MKTGIELIATKREEQKVKHGFSIEKDVELNQNDELPQAAVFAITGNDEYYPKSWDRWWRNKMVVKSHSLPPQKWRIERLTIAGALIAAELDRLLIDAQS